MKKYLLLLLTAFALTACTEEEAAPEVETPTEETESVESEAPETIEVTMETEIDKTDNKAIITGTTNLPDGGELLFTVDGTTTDYRAQSKNIFADSAFTSDTFSDKGDALPPGEYTVTISLSIPSTQSDDFVEQAGSDYEYLAGDLMQDGDFGKSLHYETNFTIN